VDAGYFLPKCFFASLGNDAFEDITFAFAFAFAFVVVFALVVVFVVIHCR